ncbi:MAG: DUF4832 domain-containing protein [Bacteroidales bacterium]|nr:DUF4832 domain-containing protein [Bacteroidales bacterium]
MKRLTFPLLLLALLCGCDGEDIPTRPGVKVIVPPELEDYTPLPLETREAGLQPMTGIVLWTDNDDAATDAIQLEFAYMLYSDVCKAKDTYDWTCVESRLDAVAARRHQAVLRFRYTYVGEECAVPDYIKALPEYEETVGESEGKQTDFPDWRCAELQRFHLDFYRRFAERYDKDPRLAFLETGFGLWAEYHIYDGPFIPGRTFPSKAFQAEFLRGMDIWFKETPWCISIDAADPAYGPFQTDPDLLEGRFGNFDDSFLCKDHDDYNASCWRFFGEDRYRRSPLGGEFSYYSNFDQKHALDRKGFRGRTFEGEAAKYHLSFIIGNDQPAFQSLARIREAGMATGYRFVVKAFRAKGTKAAVFVANEGVAPVYRDAFLVVDGIQGEFNLRELMPGEGRWISLTLPAPPNTPAFKVSCKHLVQGQQISLAISPENT